ncbi:MAG TPA: hypothetical protein VGC79_29900 [Polyangiaceae bacterium]
MTLPNGARSSGLFALTTVRALLALCVFGFAYLLGNSGCSSPTCYRNTDCPSGSDCTQGQCVRRTSGEASAGSSSLDTGAAGETD